MQTHLIYSVEDDESIRELINYALESAGYKIMSFDNAELMLAEFDKRVPELIILDLMLPGMDGIEALKIIRRKNKSVKTLILTAKTTEANKLVGLDSGADDYITKPFSVLELTARVKAHLRNSTPAKEERCALVIDGLTIDASSRSVLVDGKSINLTYKEFELLHMLMKNHDKVIERETFLKEIWGYEYYGESRTVDIHIKNLRAKLGRNGNHIVAIRSIGYIFKEKI